MCCLKVKHKKKLTAVIGDKNIFHDKSETSGIDLIVIILKTNNLLVLEGVR